MKNQSGFTLVEMMIALVLGLIVVGGGITLYGLAIRGGSDTIKSVRLNHDLDSVMLLMMNELRRAGYWAGAVDGADARNNPFTIGNSDIQILNGGNCILYTYDADGDENVDSNASPDNEYYGFRLNGTAVQIRLTGTTTADCNDGTWETINVTSGSEQVQITGLQFSFDPIVNPSVPGVTKCLDKGTLISYNSTCAAAALASGTNAAETRQINIVLGGQAANDPNVTKTLTDTVKVRNDRIFTQP